MEILLAPLSWILWAAFVIVGAFAVLVALTIAGASLMVLVVIGWAVYCGLSGRDL